MIYTIYSTGYRIVWADRYFSYNAVRVKHNGTDGTANTDGTAVERADGTANTGVN